MVKESAGILLFRKVNQKLEVLLVHPGGPFFKYKDRGAWSIPKGEVKGENKLHAAKREFREETGLTLTGGFIALAPQKLTSGKVVHAWATKGDFDTTKLTSNKTQFGWPEVDCAEWFDITTALTKINPGQSGFLQELADLTR